MKGDAKPCEKNLCKSYRYNISADSTHCNCKKWSVKIILIYKEILPAAVWCPYAFDFPFDSLEEAKEAILKLDVQDGVPVMWYQADANQNKTQKNRFVVTAIGTGQDAKDIFHRNEYIGTLMLYNDTFVLHYFITNSSRLNTTVCEMKIQKGE